MTLFWPQTLKCMVCWFKYQIPLGLHDAGSNESRQFMWLRFLLRYLSRKEYSRKIWISQSLLFKLWYFTLREQLCTLQNNNKDDAKYELARKNTLATLQSWLPKAHCFLGLKSSTWLRLGEGEWRHLDALTLKLGQIKLTIGSVKASSLSAVCHGCRAASSS